MDVVIVDATAQSSDFGDADEATRTAYVSRVGWDPEHESGAWSLITLVPRTIHAWNSVSEIHGRTIMRQGVWATS